MLCQVCRPSGALSVLPGIPSTSVLGYDMPSLTGLRVRQIESGATPNSSRQARNIQIRRMVHPDSKRSVNDL